MVIAQLVRVRVRVGVSVRVPHLQHVHEVSDNQAASRREQL